jgi:UDP-glucose 4-epimerase
MHDLDIVVTGGAGFIGSHLVDALVDKNNVLVLDDLSSGSRKFVNDEADFMKVDIRDKAALREALDSPDLIFHLAANAHTKETSLGWDDPGTDCDVNVKGTLNVFEAVRHNHPECRVVFVSSAAVYGEPDTVPITEDTPRNPQSPYGVHKRTGELHANSYVREIGLDVVSVRIFNTYGPRQPRYVIYDFFEKLRKDSSELEVLGTGQQVRDYCYVSDTVQGLTLVAERGTAGEAYNLGGGESISISELADSIIDVCDVDASVRFTSESWTGDLDRLHADISKIKKLGFEPKVGLSDGLVQFKEYYESAEGPVGQ